MRRFARWLKTLSFVQRTYHPLLTRGVAFVGRHPRWHKAARRLYRLAPGLQPYLRRFGPPPAPPLAGFALLTQQLQLVPAAPATGGGPVTIEELAFIATTL